MGNVDLAALRAAIASTLAAFLGDHDGLEAADVNATVIGDGRIGLVIDGHVFILTVEGL